MSGSAVESAPAPEPSGHARSEWLYSLGGYVHRFDLLRPRHRFPELGVFGAGGLAIDDRKNVYELNGNEVSVYDLSMHEPPKRTFTFADAEFGGFNLAVDARHRIYVSGYEDNTEVNSIQVFAPDASGAVTPIREISGPSTGLDSATGLALDTDGTLYVGDYHHEILVFAPNANGNVAPIRSFSAGNYIENIALGADANLYVASEITNTTAYVSVYPKTSSGQGNPVWTLNSGRFGYSIALGPGGTMYLGANGSPPGHIAIFAPGASGKAKPIGFVGKGLYGSSRLVLVDPWFQP